MTHGFKGLFILYKTAKFHVSSFIHCRTGTDILLKHRFPAISKGCHLETMIDIKNPEKVFLTHVIKTIMPEFEIPISINKKARLGEQAVKSSKK